MIKTILFLFVLCTPFAILIAGIIYIFLDKPTRPDDCNKISFKSFEKFYNLNPARWTLRNDYVICNLSKGSDLRGCIDENSFYFSFIDFQKYKRFKKKIDLNYKKIKNTRATAAMISAVKEDIKNMEALAERQKKQSISNMASILKDLI